MREFFFEYGNKILLTAILHKTKIHSYVRLTFEINDLFIKYRKQLL